MGRRSDNIEDRRGTGMPLGIAGGGLGTVVLLVLAYFFGVDPSIESRSSCSSPAPCSPRAGSPGAAVGPFYCPGDNKLYLDLAFFRAS